MGILDLALFERHVTSRHVEHVESILVYSIV